MKRMLLTVTIGLFGLACSKSDAPTSGSASATPSGSGASAAGPTGTNACQKKGLSKGTGTFEDMCEFPGRILKAKWTGKIDDEGASFDVTNPWPESLDWGNYSVYYYDKSGKQLEFKSSDGKSSFKVSNCSGGCINIGGNKSDQLHMGTEKKTFPAGTTSIEAEITALGWQGDHPAFYHSSDPAPEERAMGGGAAAAAPAAATTQAKVPVSAPAKKKH